MKIENLNETNVQSYIDEHRNIRTKEKNKYGEVFTPYEFITEIMDHLPTTIWSNKDVCILDPCAGTGNFMIVAYVKLMKGLQKHFPDHKKRRTHILTNMLYMIELNPSNATKLRQLFGKSANICQTNFLDSQEKWMRDLGKKQFDLIVGNPPFQTKKAKTYEGSVGNRTLWTKFITAIFDNQLLNPKGHLGFITPSNWRRPEHPLYDVLTKQNQLSYLHIYGKKDGLKKFGAQTRFDIYIVQEGSKKSSKNTKIIDEKGEKHFLDLTKWPFLPNFSYKTIEKIMVPKEKGLNILFDAGLYDARKLSKKKSKKFRHSIVHNITKRGLGLKYAKERKKHFGVSKVLFNFNEKQYPFNDFDGKYGMSQLTFGIPIKSKKQGEDIIRAVNSPKFQEILEATKWSSFQTDYRMFYYFDPEFYKKKMFQS